MTIDERARHRLYLRLEEILGDEEAGTPMQHLPPVGFGDLATKDDLARVEERLVLRMEALEDGLTARMERMGRGPIMWTSGMVLATGGLAFAGGRFI